jgi:hypothetical protein
MTDETARALLAGFISGAAVALATSFLAVVMLARSAVWQRLPQQRRVPLPLVGAAFVNLLILWWTALGLVLGAAYLRAESDHPAGALLSRNWLFTLLVVIVAASVLGGIAVVRGRFGWPVWVGALLAVLAFGWMLPALAG